MTSRVTGDPFTDPEFRDRLRKLLRLLASDQAQEADTARRKLLAQLAQHDLSAHDLADRLAGPAEDGQAALRAALSDAERRAAWAEAGLRRAEAAEAERRARSASDKRRAVWVGLASALAAAPLAASLAWFASNARGTPPVAPPPPPQAAAAGTPVPVPSGPVQADASAPGAPVPGASMFSASGAVREVRRPGEWAGAVLFNGTELRADVVPGAPVRATLPAGARVVVSGTVVHGGTAWLQVETESGPGFVLSSRVQRGG